MSKSLRLDSPRPATNEERAAITEQGLARQERIATPGEEPEVAERRAYYTQAHMVVYPVQESTARLCIVADTTVPFYNHTFGWDYEVWIATAQGEWRHLDYGDAQFTLSALEL